MTLERARLPNRRPAITETLYVGEHRIEASVGFDPATLRPAELFLCGAKDGTDLQSILSDTAVVVSVALQCGVSPRAMARSLSRVPLTLEGNATRPASVIGAALELLCQHESERLCDPVR